MPYIIGMQIKDGSNPPACYAGPDGCFNHSRDGQIVGGLITSPRDAALYHSEEEARAARDAVEETWGYRVPPGYEIKIIVYG
jgi:hypothetical protein